MPEAFVRKNNSTDNNTDTNLSSTALLQALIQQLAQGLQDYDKNKTIMKSIKYHLDEMQDHFEDMQSQAGLMRGIITSLLIVLEDRDIISRKELVEAQKKFYNKIQTPKKIIDSQVEIFERDIDFVYGDAPDETIKFIMDTLNQEYENKDDEDDN